MSSIPTKDTENDIIETGNTDPKFRSRILSRCLEFLTVKVIGRLTSLDAQAEAV